jgi:glyoxylase-like metal-dependent hydrolase (beta-lactamase superfamily II)
LYEEGTLIIEQLVVGLFQTNCYIVADEGTREAIIVDPGGDAERILETVERLECDVRLIINTHGHVDHIEANREVMEATGAPLAIHPDDANMLTNPLRSLSVFLGSFRPSPSASVQLQEGGQVQVGAIVLEVLHTPGHSPGSVSLWCAEEKVLFSGDVLFNMGIGRSDLGGNHAVLLQSIREKLFTLPDDVVVYPGHGPRTTIGHERRQNPFLI